MTPARLNFIKRMKAVAELLDTGPNVKMAIKAEDLSLLLKLSAGAAALTDMLSDADMNFDTGDQIDKETRSLNELLKQINAQVLPAVEK